MRLYIGLCILSGIGLWVKNKRIILCYFCINFSAGIVVRIFVGKSSYWLDKDIITNKNTLPGVKPIQLSTPSGGIT